MLFTVRTFHHVQSFTAVVGRRGRGRRDSSATRRSATNDPNDEDNIDGCAWAGTDGLQVVCRQQQRAGTLSRAGYVDALKNSENEKLRQSSGAARSLAAAGLSSRAGANERPSRSAGVAGPSPAPASATMVAVMSRWVVGSLESTPCGTPGPRTYIGSRTDGSYG